MFTTAGAPAGSSAVAAVDPVSFEKEAAAAPFQASVEPDPNQAVLRWRAPRRSVQAASVAGRVPAPAPKMIDHLVAAAQLGAESTERVAQRILTMV